MQTFRFKKMIDSKFNDSSTEKTTWEVVSGAQDEAQKPKSDEELSFLPPKGSGQRVNHAEPPHISGFDPTPERARWRYGPRAGANGIIKASTDRAHGYYCVRYGEYGRASGTRRRLNAKLARFFQKPHLGPAEYNLLKRLKGLT